MKPLLLLLALLVPFVAYGEDIESKFTKLSCKKFEQGAKKRFVETCDIEIEIPNLGKAKNFYCFGEVKITTKTESQGGMLSYYGFLKSYEPKSEINLVIPIAVGTQIIFPASWPVISVEKRWVKCEKSNKAL